MKNAFSTSVYWSDEDEGFVALVPEFPGLSAFGETREEAVREASDAIEGFIDSYNDEGKKLPEVRKIHEHSGNLRIRIPRSLHTALVHEAEYEDVSLNSLIANVLSEWIGKRHSAKVVFIKSMLSLSITGAKRILPDKNDSDASHVMPKATVGNMKYSYAVN